MNNSREKVAVQITVEKRVRSSDSRFLELFEISTVKPINFSSAGFSTALTPAILYHPINCIQAEHEPETRGGPRIV